MAGVPHEVEKRRAGTEGPHAYRLELVQFVTYSFGIVEVKNVNVQHCGRPFGLDRDRSRSEGDDVRHHEHCHLTTGAHRNSNDSGIHHVGSGEDFASQGQI